MASTTPSSTARRTRCNPAERGTKVAAHYQRIDRARRDATIHALRLHRISATHAPFADFDAHLRRSVRPRRTTSTPRFGRRRLDGRRRGGVQRQAFAGLLWSKQFYHYDVERLARRRPGAAAAAGRARSTGATATGGTSTTRDIISMPDKWEYPWFAAWDLAFHCIPLALVDPDFAKQQLHRC